MQLLNGHRNVQLTISKSFSFPTTLNYIGIDKLISCPKSYHILFKVDQPMTNDPKIYTTKRKRKTKKHPQNSSMGVIISSTSPVIYVMITSLADVY